MSSNPSSQRHLTGRRRLAVALGLCALVTCASAEDQAAPTQALAERVVRDFWAAFNRADWQGLDSLVAPDYRHHPPGQSLTLQQFKDGGAWVHKGLANYVLTIDSLVQGSDTVAIRWTARGTHVGSFFGEPPSGRQVVVQGMHFHKVVEGRIAEDWEVIDFDGFKRQLGIR